MSLRVPGPKINVESIKSHILFYLFRKGKPVRLGDVKGKMLGTEIPSQEVLDALFELGYIAFDDNHVQLSEEGKLYMEQLVAEETRRIQKRVFEDDFDLGLLEFLYFRPHLVHLEDFPQLLKDHAPQHGNSINDGNLSQSLFRLRKYIHDPYTSWYGLNETGRAFYEYKAGITSSAREKKENAGGEYFSEQEKEDMNRKLDQILEKLEKTGLEHEVIWTDMKADFEELKGLYKTLNKKSWRQLFLGKMTDWVAGGVVAETLSKKIVEAMKPVADKLLGGN